MGIFYTTPTLHIDLPDLAQVSTLGLCHMMDALRCGGDGLFRPAGGASYPVVPEGDLGFRAVDAILEGFTALEDRVEAELLSRPVPVDPDERDLRARVLTDRHLRCRGMDGFHDLAGRL